MSWPRRIQCCSPVAGCVVVVMMMQVMTTVVMVVEGAQPRYLWGNALTDSLEHTTGPDGQYYPTELIDELYSAGEFGGATRQSTRGRSLFGATLDPGGVSNLLLKAQEHHGGAGHDRAGRNLYPRSAPSSERATAARKMAASDINVNLRIARDDDVNSTSRSEKDEEFVSEQSAGGCPVAPPSQLCPTVFNTTAPMWGTSLTSGKKVTIVQKFPDLLQQVIFHECKSEECDFIHGRCLQTYTPYLFLVIPLGPVTLTGQDYVMVESGCACHPKYASGAPYDTPLDAFLG